MNIFEKFKWYFENSDNGVFDSYTDQDWNTLESELINMINTCTEGILLQKCLSMDITYLMIPYPVRLALHERLVELQPDNEQAIKDYAFYLDAFGDEPEEIKAAEMLKKLEERNSSKGENME